MGAESDTRGIFKKINAFLDQSLLFQQVKDISHLGAGYHVGDLISAITFPPSVLKTTNQKIIRPHVQDEDRTNEGSGV